VSNAPAEEEGAWTKPRFHIPFYDDVLKVTEVWIVLIMLLLVISATFINIIDRNFQIGIWEYAVIEKMVYSLTFFIGMYGGVIAARRCKHISVDAVTHFLTLRQRRSLGVIMQIIGGLTCAVIAMACYDWIHSDLVPADDTLVPGKDEWWLSTRLWRWPVVIAFAWMTLHFFVNAGRFFYDAMWPPQAPGS